MANTIFIRYISGNIFQEFQYNDFNELYIKLKYIIRKYDSDVLIQLLIDDEMLNNFDIIDTFVLSKLNKHNYISVILSNKKTLYCLDNINGKYILDYKNDNYTKILSTIIEFYENDSYDIIINSSYKDLVLKALKNKGLDLRYASSALQNSKEVVLESIKKTGYGLKYASINLRYDREFILECVKIDGIALEFVGITLQNDREIVLEAIKQNGYSITYANTEFKNDKEIILEAIKQNKNALKYIRR